MFHRRLLLLLALAALMCLGVARQGDVAYGGAARAPADPPVVAYDAARYPDLFVVAGRVVAETDPRLDAAQRAALWRQYGLEVQFEWVRPATATDPGFTYHELRLRDWTPLDQAAHALRCAADRLLGRPAPPALAPRDLPRLVAQLNDDPRLHWAAPDALLLQWADDAPARPPVRAAAGGGKTPHDPPQTQLAAPADQQWTPARQATAAANLGGGGKLLRGGYSVGFVDAKYKMVLSVKGWEDAVHKAAAASTQDKPLDIAGPLPEFEYYRLATPQGNPVDWAPELKSSALFMQRCARVYGTGEADALAAYHAAGAPPLSPVTVCLADTGLFMNHPDFAGRLHPNAIDCNYTTYRIAAPGERAGPDAPITDRGVAEATGLPRVAIRDKPASHGTCVGGEIERCTRGFYAAAAPEAAAASGGGSGERGPAVRLLPVSIKSDKAVAFVVGGIKTPISSFIRLVYCLHENFPTGPHTPAPGDRVQNTGDVRVVSISASVPKSYFTDAEWRIVANLAGKAAGAVAEDLRTSDRLYVFAAGNEAQAAPNKPGDVDYVQCVSAARPFDGAQAWYESQFAEGSNVGADCVSAPGEGLITSTLYKCPNLKYLPDNEFRSVANWSTPRTGRDWTQETNEFGATSGATPQVSALAALLYAQQPQRKYTDVLKAIRDSTQGRTLTAPYGQSMGLIDYRVALGWGGP